MNNKLVGVVVGVAVLALSHSDQAGALTQHYNKTIFVLEAANSPCYFFQLEGVAQADPIVSSPWFAIPTTQANAKEMYAMLLSARVSGATLTRVLTSGNVACGGAEVFTIDF